MKKLTLAQVAEALQNSMSIEYKSDLDTYVYYLDLDEYGEITDDVSSADIIFESQLGFAPKDDSYDWENLDNKYFSGVAEDLLAQANEYIESK